MKFTLDELIQYINVEIMKVDGIWDEEYQKLKQIKELLISTKEVSHD